MKTFTIDNDNNITAFASPEEAAASSPTPFDIFASDQDLAEVAAQWPAARLVATWNGLPGVTRVEKFQDRKTAVSRIWKRIQGLGESVAPATPPSKPKAERNARGRAQSANVAPAKRKAARKATAAKYPAQAKKAGPAEAGARVPRAGSKTAQVVAMLQRKNGATLAEIMKAMSWQRHTVRGFMAGAMKRAGYPIESFKSEAGERTYRTPK
jgi:hypothetical protein